MRFGGAALAAILVVAAAGCGAETSSAPVEALWSEHCAGCHGADGSGVPARRGLEPRLDLRRSEMLRPGVGSPGLVFQRIAYGYSTMPGFAHKLSRGDIQRLAKFTAGFAAR
jgi:mono/diheme cytochrome c family protein